MIASTHASKKSFIAFGVALDPRQQELFGIFAGPFAVGCALGLTSFASAGLVKGYNGTGMNPARCFAFAVGRKDFQGRVFVPLAVLLRLCYVMLLTVNDIDQMDMVDWTNGRDIIAYDDLPVRASVS